MNDLISIIIRTKNEERWIGHVLRAVFNQRYKNFEVIIVDNESTDKTLAKAAQFKIRPVVRCKKYFPGKALNLGIRAAKGKYIVSLSGHCIPVNDSWLCSLAGNFNDDSIAGVYGRQEAMSFTSDADKRDLALVFGLDKKVQIKDSFFHNANSMFSKELWAKFPFDETVTNIEDRIWAHRILQEDYRIVYEPAGSVYHYHGIHQDGNVERCGNVVRILEDLNRENQYKSINAERVNVVAIIPVKGPVQYLNKRPLLSYTIERALGSKYIKRVIVSTDDKKTAVLAGKMGAETPFIREPYLSEKYVDLGRVLQYSLDKIEQLRIFPDLVVLLEATFPFRDRDLLDRMILQLIRNGFDSVIAAKKENKAIWKENGGRIVQLDEGLTPRQFKEPAFLELKGLGCVTHPEFLRQGRLLGDKIGIYEVDNPYSCLEVRDETGLRLASCLVDGYFNNK